MVVLLIFMKQVSQSAQPRVLGTWFFQMICCCISGFYKTLIASLSLFPLSPSCNHHLFFHIVWSSVSGPRGSSPDATFGLLLGVFVVCGLALLGLLTLVSWKLCRATWRTKAHYPSLSLSPVCGPERSPLQPPPPLPIPQQPPATMATEKVKDPVGSLGFLEAAVKISHTSPDIPTDVQLSMREHFLRRTQRMQRQTTEPTSSTRLVKSARACTCACVCVRLIVQKTARCGYSCENMLRGT